jgi:hypothetical protein
VRAGGLELDGGEAPVVEGRLTTRAPGCLPFIFSGAGRTYVRTRAGRRGIGGKGWSAAARIFERFGGGERMERKKARTHCTQAGTHAQRPDDNATVYVCVWRGEEDDGKGKSRQAAC